MVAQMVQNYSILFNFILFIFSQLIFNLFIFSQLISTQSHIICIQSHFNYIHSPYIYLI